MKTSSTLGSRCAAILRQLGVKPSGLSYGSTARIIDQCAKRN
jgi:hypothetical protein